MGITDTTDVDVEDISPRVDSKLLCLHFFTIVHTSNKEIHTAHRSARIHRHLKLTFCYLPNKAPWLIHTTNKEIHTGLLVYTDT